MGKENQFSGKLSRILKEKRMLAFPLLLIAIIAFGLVLQGCGAREEIIKDGCGEHEDDYVRLLPGLDDETYQAIKVNLCWPGGRNKIFVDVCPLSEGEKEAALAAGMPFEITSLITYFQVKDAKTGELKTEFDPSLELHVEYTAEAWDAAFDKEFKRPRLAYLIRKENSWAAEWVEFTDEYILNVIPPGTGGDPHGYLHISIGELGDPLIGGI